MVSIGNGVGGILHLVHLKKESIDTHQENAGPIEKSPLLQRIYSQSYM
jgi:hypothetical protein